MHVLYPCKICNGINKIQLWPKFKCNLKLKQSFPLGFSFFQFCDIEGVGIYFQKLAKLVELIQRKN